MSIRSRALAALAVAACGHHGNAERPDAGASPNDTGANDGALDASAARIAVVVHGGFYDAKPGEPMADVPVYFIAPDRTVQKIVSGADGVASAIAPANTTALVARGQDPSWTLSAYVGLAPGDTLVDGMAAPLPASSPGLGSITFAFPTMANAASYGAYVSCQSAFVARTTSTSVQLPVSSCAGSGNADAIAIAWDASVNAIGYTAIGGLDLASRVGTTVDLPAFTPASTMIGTFSNVADIDLVDFGAIATKASILTYSAGASKTVEVATTIAIPFVPYGDRTSFYVQLAKQYGGLTYAQQYLAGSAQLATAFALDASTRLRFATGRQYNATVGTVSWHEQADGDAPTLVHVAVHYQHAATQQSVDLALIAPYGQASSVALPALPDDLGTLALATTDALSIQTLDVFGVPGKTYHDAMLDLFGGGTQPQATPTPTDPYWLVQP